ncbi:MAG: DUF1573 domain-containing protein [Bacteroidaceae bacterium]|nr:DUF1573 domain-containing protein [Bacteroidaceae bacterium]
MKKIILSTLLLATVTLGMNAFVPQKNSVTVGTTQDGEKAAEIKFDTLTHDFGTFAEKDGVVKCTFKFTNVGNAPLIIHQAIASCGCTVPNYPKDPIKPGEGGAIDVTYNGAGKFAGRFKKNITVRSNAKESSVVRLTIEGNMTTE